MYVNLGTKKHDKMSIFKFMIKIGTHCFVTGASLQWTIWTVSARAATVGWAWPTIAVASTSRSAVTSTHGGVCPPPSSRGAWTPPPTVLSTSPALLVAAWPLVELPWTESISKWLYPSASRGSSPLFLSCWNKAYTRLGSRKYKFIVVWGTACNGTFW